MEPRRYENLDVTFTHIGADDTHTAFIEASPVGRIGPVPVRIDATSDRLKLLTLQLAPGRLTTRRVASVTTAVAEELGDLLFKAVFHDELLSALRTSSDQHPRGLRIRLRLGDAPDLAWLPWELMFDDSRFKFLAMSERTPIVRYLEADQPAPMIEVPAGLRILVITSQPVGYPALNVDSEYAAIRTEFAAYIEAGLITVDRLPRPSLAELRRWLRSNAVHILHFVGHGAYDPSRDDGVLYFTDDAGQAKAVDATELGPYLHDHDALQLVVLNACESAQGGRDDRFSGVAQGLIERGVPAVVAMQFPVTDGAAVCFSADFYASLAEAQPVDQAVSGSRQALQGGFDTEWVTPVLFLRSDQTRLFDVPRAAVAAAVQLPTPGSVPPPAEEEPSGVRMKQLPHPPPVRAASTHSAQSPRRRRRTLGALLSLAVIVAAVIGAVLILGRHATAGNAAGSTTPHPTPTVRRPITSAVLQNVYDVIADRGVQDLTSQGFTHVRQEQVCSNSVAVGRIRQVILDNNAQLGAETEVVGENGPSNAAWPFATSLVVKVSTGPC